MYEAVLCDPLQPAQVQRLLDGVVLDDAPEPVRALQCEATGDHALRLVIAEGRYHQVKRMVAAAGNRVETLHRSRIGGLALPADLAPGLGAGLALMLLCRLNLQGPLEPATWLLLAVSGVLHVLDLMRRWPRGVASLSAQVSR